MEAAEEAAHDEIEDLAVVARHRGARQAGRDDREVVGDPSRRRCGSRSAARCGSAIRRTVVADRIVLRAHVAACRSEARQISLTFWR
jgi:hypothetical protein